MLKKLIFILCIFFTFNASISWSQPHNIIIIIGDGMGFEQVKAAGIYDNGSEGTLNFESLPNQAEMTTFSADSSVTDSAASATAMATATKVNNGVISTAIPGDSSELETVLEYFSAKGKSTGLVTTAYITHATPAAFGAHEPSRGNFSGIALDYLTQTRPNVLLGGGANGISVSTASAAGYTVVTDRVGMQGLNTDIETMVSGQFGTYHMPYEYDYFTGTDTGYDVLPHLTEMTVTALDILDNDPDGFFLMVEGARIDHAGHDSEIERNIFETIEFDDTIQIVMNWAQGRSDTLVLVTADHETGGLTVTQNNGQGVFPDVTWSAGGGHTDDNVPVYAWGVNANLVSGVMDNTDIYDVATSGPDISVSPVSVNFGDVTEGSSSTPQIITISNAGSVDLSVSDIQLAGNDPGEFELDVVGGTATCGSTSPVISAGNNCTVTVTFSPTSEGTKTADLEIDSDDSDESTVIIALSGTGLVQPTPDIDVTDSILPVNDHQMDFGEITEFQSSAPEMVTIQNTGTADLSVSNIQLAGADPGEFDLDVDGGTPACGSIFPAVISAGNECTVTVTFSPTSDGAKSADLIISSDDADEPSVTVILRGTGLILFTPEINVSDSILPDNDLQLQFVDTKTLVSSDPETVTISNIGTFDLSVSDIQLTGADPGEFDLDVNGGLLPCGNTSPVISPGSNCTISITFSPTSEGAKLANLGISSNDSNESTVTVALNGTGVDNNPPTPANLVYPTNGRTNLETTIDFSWNKSTDPDPGDVVSYELLICTDQNFTQGCITETVTASLANKGVYFAGSGYGLVLFGIVLLGSERGRKNLVFILIVVMLSSTLVACGGSGDDPPPPPSGDITHQITGFNSGTTYYWKVVADDGNGGTTDSEIRSFSTQ